MKEFGKISHVLLSTINLANIWFWELASGRSSLPSPYLGLTKKLELAIRLEETGQRVGPWEMHQEVKNTYLWSDVMRRTELVYSKVHQEESSADLVHRIPRWSCFALTIALILWTVLWEICKGCLSLCCDFVFTYICLDELDHYIIQVLMLKVIFTLL